MSGTHISGVPAGSLGSSLMQGQVWGRGRCLAFLPESWVPGGWGWAIAHSHFSTMKRGWVHRWWVALPVGWKAAGTDVACLGRGCISRSQCPGRLEGPVEALDITGGAHSCARLAQGHSVGRSKTRRTPTGPMSYCWARVSQGLGLLLWGPRQMGMEHGNMSSVAKAFIMGLAE